MRKDDAIVEPAMSRASRMAHLGGAARSSAPDDDHRIVETREPFRTYRVLVILLRGALQDLTRDLPTFVPRVRPVEWTSGARRKLDGLPLACDLPFDVITAL